MSPLNRARAKLLKSSFRSVVEGVTIFMPPVGMTLPSEARHLLKIKGFAGLSKVRRVWSRGLRAESPRISSGVNTPREFGFTLADHRTKVHAALAAWMR